jgi:hypothetical protein
MSNQAAVSAQNPRGAAKAGVAKTDMSTAALTAHAARLSTLKPAVSVATAVAKMSALGKRKNVPKPFTEAEKRAYAEKQAAHRELRNYWKSFPVDEIAVIDDNGRSKVVLKDKDGVADPKEKALIELCPLRTVIGSRMVGEGNRGMGDFKPTPGEAKRSLGLAQGSIDGKPLHPTLAAEQPACVEVIKAAARAALGAWFDTDNIAEECPSGYASAMLSARTSIAHSEHETYHRSFAEVEDAEAKDNNLAQRVREDARQLFIDGGRIPFGIVKDPKTKKVLPETAWTSSKVWPMKKDAWTPQLDKNRNKGPSLQQVPSSTANMPRLMKIMDELGHEFREPQYENGKAQPNSPNRTLRAPTKLVPDLNELGELITDAADQAMMFEAFDLTWNPLFESANKKKLISLVQVSVILGLSNGGQKGKYGVNLTQSGPIVITSQAEQKAGESYMYDDDIATGLYQDAEEGGRGDDPDALEEDEQDAGVTVTTNVNLHGLAGATIGVPPPPVASTSDAPEELGDDGPHPPLEPHPTIATPPPVKRTRK